jgi:tyrosine phenol-lyase
MSDNQLAAMIRAEDAYAGSEIFYRLAESSKGIFAFDYVIPAHQGQTVEHQLAKSFI